VLTHRLGLLDAAALPMNDVALSNAGGALSPRELGLLRALAEAALPAGSFLPGVSEETLASTADYVGTFPPRVQKAYRAALWALELETLPRFRGRFSTLPLATRQRALEGWEKSRLYAARTLLRLVLTPAKLHHFARPEMYAHVGCRTERAPVRDESPRYLARVTNGRDITADTTLECEVVVIGTGAGGAAAAYELARRGRAVLLLEEGDLHRRASFRGRSIEAYRALYRDGGLTASMGNVGIPIWAGRAVGGSTLINAGTCYRTPASTLARWRAGFGLPSAFSPEGLDDYFQRVESMLGVAPTERQHLGVIADIVARGAERLGFSHAPLPRNAPGCDGQGVCCYGCPTGAKRSTDTSYIPSALLAGAELITAARCERIEVVAGHARGVVAELRGTDEFRAKHGRGPELRVRAEAVVVAAGTLLTPSLLRRSEVCLTSGQLGKNLSIHPATKVMALFDERIDQANGVPQGYGVDELAEQGLMFEGSSLPLDVAAIGVPWTGPRFTELMEQYPHLATFGFMIRDTSRGEVRGAGRGTPRILYSLNDHDVALLQRGVATLTELFHKAGAKRVFPFVAGHDEVSTASDLAHLTSAKLRARDFELSAFHPLGTCRLGTDPRTSCLDPDHQAWDTKGLWITDGSAVPSSLGVNPQVTIMALALRAAEAIHASLG
jgi:choline dehydrogenase-like flavoprotein